MSPELREAAVAWHLRLRDGSGDDWDAFTDWLAADPAHAASYDRVAIADAELDGLELPSALPLAANDDTPPRRSRRWLAGAAGLAAAVVTFALVRPGTDPQAALVTLTTAPGEQRVVALGAGSRVAMNGGTTLVLRRGDPRFAELKAGEALFEVRHDAAVPFTVLAGRDRIVDVGTMFNVVHSADGLSVAVASGSVRVNPDAENVMLAAGDMLSRAAAGPYQKRHGDPAAVTGWQRGRLDFDGSSLASVAAALTRNTGTAISVDPAIRAQSFSGTILLAGPPGRTVSLVADLAGVSARPEGKGWHLGPRGRDPR